MRIFFVRHGESEANILHQISNRGWMHGLTDAGRRQAADLARRLIPERPDHIYTSPLMRAVQTTEILAAELGIGFTIAEALREYDCGIAEGRADLEAWEWYRRGRWEWWQEHNWDFRIPEGESLNDLRRRFEPFVRGLVGGKIRGEAAGTHQPCDEEQKTLILVSHGGVYQCMLPFVLENVFYPQVQSLAFPNTGFVLGEAAGGRLRGIEWCRTKLEP